MSEKSIANKALNHSLLLSLGFTYIVTNHEYRKYDNDSKKRFYILLRNGCIWVEDMNGPKDTNNLKLKLASYQPFIRVQKLLDVYKNETGIDLVFKEVAGSTPLTKELITAYGFHNPLFNQFQKDELLDKLSILFIYELNIMILKCLGTKEILLVENNIFDLETFLIVYKQMTNKNLEKINDDTSTK